MSKDLEMAKQLADIYQAAFLSMGSGPCVVWDEDGPWRKCWLEVAKEARRRAEAMLEEEKQKHESAVKELYRSQSKQVRVMSAIFSTEQEEMEYWERKAFEAGWNAEEAKIINTDTVDEAYRAYQAERSGQ